MLLPSKRFRSVRMQHAGGCCLDFGSPRTYINAACNPSKYSILRWCHGYLTPGNHTLPLSHPAPLAPEKGRRCVTGGGGWRVEPLGIAGRWGSSIGPWLSWPFAPCTRARPACDCSTLHIFVILLSLCSYVRGEFNGPVFPAISGISRNRKNANRGSHGENFGKSRRFF